MKRHKHHTDSTSDSDSASKSQRKRDMLALQAMGEALIRLPAGKLEHIEMTDQLRNAIADARDMSKHGALHRQKQYIGKLMRNIDPQPIREALDRLKHDSNEQKRQLHTLENWRDRLIDEGDIAVRELLSVHPECDRQHLRQLIRSVHKEQERNQAPAANRKLFQYLKALIE
jgi:ribosome-associated protein